MSKYRTTSMSIDIGGERPTLIDIRVIGPVLARYRPDSLVLLGTLYIFISQFPIFGRSGSQFLGAFIV